MNNDDDMFKGQADPQGESPRDKRKSANHRPEPELVLYCPDFHDINLHIPEDFTSVDRGFRSYIENNREIKKSWFELDSASTIEQEDCGAAVYKCEELCSHLRAALDLISRNIFMMDRPEWDEGKFGDTHRIYVPRSISAIASQDLAQVAVLVEVLSKGSGRSCLPPWQAIYPGPINEFGNFRRGGNLDSQHKKVTVATGVTMNVNSEIAPEEFGGDVALVLMPKRDAKLDVLFAPRRGDHDFEAEPVFSSVAWSAAISDFIDDVRLIENSIASDKGTYGFGISDIARANTSFLLGYSMVVAREKSHIAGWGETIIMPSKSDSYRIKNGLAGESIDIKGVVGTSSWGEETVFNLKINLDSRKRTPMILLKRS